MKSLFFEDPFFLPTITVRSDAGDIRRHMGAAQALVPANCSK